MAEGPRPVSIPGVGFAWIGLALRHRMTALSLMLTPLAVMAVLWAIVIVGPLKRSGVSPVVVLVLLGGLALLGLGAGQLLVCRALLGGTRLRLATPGWSADLGRILVVTLVWVAAIVVLQIAAAFGLQQTGLGASPSLYNGISYALGLPLLLLPLLWLGLTASAIYQQRRWLLIVRLPPWPDLWRILLGWAIVSAQVITMWWAVGRVSHWMANTSQQAIGPLARSAISVAILGGPMGLTMLLLAAGSAQAWRQSLGRPGEDPMAVFD